MASGSRVVINKGRDPSFIWCGITYGYTLLERGIQWDRDQNGGAHIRWLPSSKGVFKTKSAYELLSPDNAADTSFNWQQVWRFMGPARALITIGWKQEPYVWTIHYWVDDMWNMRNLARDHTACSPGLPATTESMGTFCITSILEWFLGTVMFVTMDPS